MQGGLYSPLRAGKIGSQRWLVQCTPHSLFCEKRECAVHGGREKTGARKKCRLFDTHVPTHGVVRAGVGWLKHGLSSHPRCR